MIRLENVFKTSLQDVLKMSWKRFKDALARRLKNVLKISWSRMTKVLTKTSWRRLEDIFWRYMTKMNIFVLIKISSSSSSWRCLLKTKIKDVFKTSSRRLHQDEYFLTRLFINRFRLCFNLFVILFFVTPCLIVAIQPSWSESQFKKNILLLDFEGLKYKWSILKVYLHAFFSVRNSVYLWFFRF